MKVRIFSLLFFVLGVFLILHRERSCRLTKIHYPAAGVKLSEDKNQRPFYGIGKYENIQTPNIGLIDTLKRKKINNYVFNHYNQYKIQIIFVDLGYGSVLQFNFFSEDNGQFGIEEKIGFDLPQRFDDTNINLSIKKKKFQFYMTQNRDVENSMTITTFNFTSSRKYHNITFNLTHIIRDEQCFTAIRTGDVISHKCYGGYGEGKLKIERYISQTQTKRNSIYNPTFNLTRCSFDGLRGSSFHWQWVWGMASGFSKPQFYANDHKIDKERWIGLNFGSLNSEGEDFAFINGEIVAIQGLKYEIEDNLKVGKVLFFESEKPKMEANFTVLHVNHIYNDMGILKVDMIKGEGHWAGWVEDKDGVKIEFYLIAGVVQSANSLF